MLGVAPDFYTTKVITMDYPLHHGVSFHPLLFIFHLQITYRKVRNLKIGVDKLVGKVSIHLLHQQKSAAYIISISIKLLKLYITTTALLCKYVIVNKCM